MQQLLAPVQRLLPPQVFSPQSFSHQLCDSQQLRREVQRPKRPKRDSEELRMYAGVALRLYFARAGVLAPSELQALPALGSSATAQSSQVRLSEGQAGLAQQSRLERRVRQLRGAGTEPWDAGSQ